MNKDALRLGGIAVLLLAALGVAASLYVRGQEAEREARIAEEVRRDAGVFVREHSPSLGPKNAAVTLVEFLDPECEACRVMHPLVKRLIAEYDDRVRYVVRYMPLHGNSVYAAGALEAARAQGLYWEMLETLFANQPVWGDHEQPRPELIPGYARDLGLDMAAFERFLDAGGYRMIVEMDRSDGISLGVRGTPSFFVNGKPLAHLGYEPLRAMIDAELRQQDGQDEAS